MAVGDLTAAKAWQAPRLPVLAATSRSPLLLILQAIWFAVRLVGGSSPALLAASLATTVVFGLPPMLQMQVGKPVLDAPGAPAA